MNSNSLIALALCVAGPALAQDAGLSVSVGARAWYTEWTTFGYITDANDQNIGLAQVSADKKLVLIPLVSLRYGSFSGSFSVFPSTDFSFTGGGSNARKEYDLNLGYALMPGLNLTLGYKKVSQRQGPDVYRPAGPVVGLSANAPLAGAWSFYGSLGLGRLKTPSGDPIDFKADYRLTELGLAYALNTERPRWSFTAGYRIQVLSSKQAFENQDGRDTTQGLTVGALATF